jgi:dTDP-4-dehydrorhamnose 3,5-epimerase
MIIEGLELQGAYRLRLTRQPDERGYFVRRFCASTFAEHGLETDFVQRSFSHSLKRGTLRGLHFQLPPNVETKLVRCTRGAIFDVTVDLRMTAATYGRWHAEELSPESFTALYIPCGFAHGFQTLMDDTEVDYEITSNYVPSAKHGVRYDDPDLRIPWPISNPILSQVDRTWPSLARVTKSKISMRERARNR